MLLPRDAVCNCLCIAYQMDDQIIPRIVKPLKVEKARELGEKKAAEKTIERTFFCKLFDSEYCMKGDPKVLAQKLKLKKSSIGGKQYLDYL